MDGDDYFVVMVYVNQYCYDTLHAKTRMQTLLC
jgi:hypothetical protein